eukprot:2727757-Amphidinium_carterae.1
MVCKDSPLPFWHISAMVCKDSPLPFCSVSKCVSRSSKKRCKLSTPQLANTLVTVRSNMRTRKENSREEQCDINRACEIQQRLKNWAFPRCFGQ